MVAAHIIAGPFKGSRINLTEEKPRIEIKGVVYTRIDDPDTGESLHAYSPEVP